MTSLHDCPKLHRMRTPWRAALIGAAVAALVTLPGLGSGTLWDNSETAYGEVAREIFLARDWVVLHFNGDPWFVQPPLYFWIAAICAKIFGVTTLALRLPAALATIAVGAMTAYAVARQAGMRAGIYAGVILSTCLMQAIVGRLAIMDALLDLFVAATIFAWFGASPIDGYRAYRVDGGQHTLVYHHTAGAQRTIAFIDTPSVGFNGKCYAITAYKGSAESAPSAPFCVGGSTPVGIQNTTLVSGHVKWLGASNGGNTGSAAGQVIKVFANLPYPGEGLPETGNLRGLACDRAGDTMCVGFVYNTTKHWYGDDFSNAWIRSAVWFDIGSLHAKQIWSAKLTLNIADAEAGGDTHSVPNLNCISKVEAASSAWWNGASWLDSNASRAATGINQTGSQVTIDVTVLAHLWLAGTPNDGLVLIGPSEDPNAFTENSCLSGYNSAVLTVQFTS